LIVLVINEFISFPHRGSLFLASLTDVSFAPRRSPEDEATFSSFDGIVPLSWATSLYQWGSPSLSARG